MSKERIRKFRKIYGICMAAYSGFVGLLFIIQVWSIFLSTPDKPYTVASITLAFNQIAVWVWLWVAGLLVGAFIPKAEPVKEKAHVSSQIQLERLYKRVNYTEEIAKKIKPLKTIRIVLVCTQLVVWAAAIIVGIVLLTKENYQPMLSFAFFKKHNGLVDRLVCLMPWLLSGTAVSVGATLVAEFTRKKEIEILKQELINKAKTAEKITKRRGCLFKRICNAVSNFLQKPVVVLITRIMLGVVGVVFVVFGIFNGGMADVLEKAVKICTQCIGLG